MQVRLDFGGTRTMSLATARLTFDPVLLDDAKALSAGEPAGWTWLDGGPFEGTQVAAGMVVISAGSGHWQPEWGIFVLVRSGDGVAVGGMGFHGPPSDGEVEIGFDLCEPARGHGYATEGLTALAAWALAQPGVDVVIARTEEENVASQHVMERAGFTRVESTDDLWRYELAR
jgi:RimJ/RimL family protein N-acetyltransferase